MSNYLLKTFSRKSGKLIPFSFTKDIPFRPKRIFLIYGKKNFTRGDHAHYKCSQYLVPLSGKMQIEYENKIKKFKKIISSNKKNCILLKPKTWCKIKFQTNKCILMVFCDRDYEFRDYIENYKD